MARARLAWLVALTTAGAPALADTKASMYSIHNGDCSEVAVDPKLKDQLAMFSQFSLGTCQDAGYTETKGSKNLTLPVIGRITVSLAKKPNVLDEVLALASPLSSAENCGPCAKSCVAPNIKYFSVDEAHGHCGEACMNPQHIWIFKAFEPNLTEADNRTCRSLGFPIYNSTETHGFPPLTITVDMYSPAPLDKVTFAKLALGVCVEATVNKESGPMVEAAGFAAGFCADKGYVKSSGTKSLQLPMLEDVEASVFRKPGELDLVDGARLAWEYFVQEEVVLHQVVNGVCSQASMDKKLADAVTPLAIFKVGPCKEQGFTEPAGYQEAGLPVLGKIRMEVYKAPSKASRKPEVHV